MRFESQPDPRANQKERTRAAIVEAALAILGEGAMPTVASAAARAKVSRATAYRYFSSQDELGEALGAYHPSIATIDELVENLSSPDVEERVLDVVDTYNAQALAHEAHMRSTLRLLQDHWLETRREGTTPYMRARRRLTWLDEALRPAEGLPEEERVRLRAALAMTMGIEALIVMKDVCKLGDDEARAVLRWAATTLLRSSLGHEGAARA